MEAHDLLLLAREIIGKVPACMAITVDLNGGANARVVNPKPLSDAWTVRFATHRRSRKVQEIQRSGRLTLAYQYDPDSAYVTLIGHAAISDDVAAKTANWRPESYRWYPGGPTDPDVVYVDFTADRVELWSSRHGVEPDPAKGLWAAVLIRGPSGWHLQTTFPQSGVTDCGTAAR